jgi:hypothetical protein
MRAERTVAALLTAAILSGWLPAQDDKEEAEIRKTPVDPYTEGDAARMAAAGIVAYGPFAWGDHLRTTDVDRVLGAGRVLWIETAHFRIGCNLRTAKVPVEAEPKKHLHDEVSRLRKKLPKVKEKPRELDPWLRAHLYAQRAEELYAEFQQLIGVTDADFGEALDVRSGKYLGMPDKFLLLLFQKKSDLARYLERFCNTRGDISYRYEHVKSHQMLAAFAAEGLENADELALSSHVTYSLVHNFCDGYMGFCYPIPPWLPEGLAHHRSRRIPTNFVNVGIGDRDIVDEQRQHLWPQKVRARADHDYFLKSADLMAMKPADMDLMAHMFAWSRVDFLMQKKPEGVGAILKALKSFPMPRVDRPVKPEDLASKQLEVLQEQFGLDPAALDTQWRAWVLKTYPKK